jgi:Uma2 family endonuclease
MPNCDPSDARQHIVLDDISWDLYERLLEAVEYRSLRLTYNDGVLQMMAPLFEHEKWKGWIGRLIEYMAVERRIAVVSAGSTTFRRKERSKGLEPDECYYVANADSIRRKRVLDLSIDPPPDLGIEVDIWSGSVARQPIYQALGIPELWRFDGQRITVLRLNPDGSYETVSDSGVFPFLPMKQFEAFVLRLESENLILVLDEFRAWVRSL